MITSAQTVERTGLTTLREHAASLSAVNEKSSADLIPRCGALERGTNLILKTGAFHTVIGEAAHAEAQLDR